MDTKVHTRAAYHAPRSELDPEVAILLGLHAGDGWVSKDWGLSINAQDKQMVKSIVKLVRQVLGVEPFVRPNKSKSISIRSGYGQVNAFFMRYGFPRGKKSATVAVPKEIMASRDNEVVRGFLRGLFSADGSFSVQRERYARCEIQVSSPALRDGFAELALRLGHCFKTYSYVKTTGKNRLPLNVAYFGRREQASRWMEDIGSLSDSNARRYQRWKRRMYGIY